MREEEVEAQCGHNRRGRAAHAPTDDRRREDRQHEHERGVRRKDRPAERDEHAGDREWPDDRREPPTDPDPVVGVVLLRRRLLIWGLS